MKYGGERIRIRRILMKYYGERVGVGERIFVFFFFFVIQEMRKQCEEYEQN